jgi:hypothetical protein
MADHKFEFTLSGVTLSDAQKHQIASDIALAVTRAVVGTDKPALSTPMWSLLNIHGGRMIGSIEGVPELLKEIQRS